MNAFDQLAPQAATGMERLRALLKLPRGRQLDAVHRLRANLPAPPPRHTPPSPAPLNGPPGPEAAAEDWNTAFGPRSLYEAWSRTPLMRALYAANAATLRAWLDRRPDWTVVEVGGGNGRLWAETLREGDRGTLVVIDPHPEPAARISALVPEGVTVVHRRAAVPNAAIPEADAVVCSLTLHHVAGADADERARHGMTGPGKREALTAMADALRSRGGLLLLNEADIYCDLGLRPGDPILAERLLDSYVRRCAAALLCAIDEEASDPDLRARWWTIIRRWCLDQVDVAQRPVEARDVYELDVPRWLDLLDAAGLTVLSHDFTDPWNLFHRYVCVPR